VRYRGGGVYVFGRVSAVCGLLSAAALLAGMFVGLFWVAVVVLVRLVVVRKLMSQQRLPVMAGLFLAGLEGLMLFVYHVWWPTFCFSQLYYHNETIDKFVMLKIYLHRHTQLYYQWANTSSTTGLTPVSFSYIFSLTSMRKLTICSSQINEKISHVLPSYVPAQP